MDNMEEGNMTSSMVDDSFFIVKKCIRYGWICVHVVVFRPLEPVHEFSQGYNIKMNLSV